MTHSSVDFGVGYYVLVGIATSIWLLSAAMIVDPMRAKRAAAYDRYVRAGVRKVPLYVYQILGFLYLLLIMLAVFAPFGEALRSYSLLALPVIFAVEVVYLLRVAFPKPLPDDVFVEGDPVSQSQTDELGIRYVAPSGTSNVEESSDNDDGE